MVEVQNSNLINDMSEKTKISNVAVLPKNLSNVIVPTIDVGKNIHKHFAIYTNKTTTGTAYLGTTSSTKDTYITGLVYSYAKDVNCDVTNVNLGIDGFLNGASTKLIHVSSIPLTAAEGTIAVNFNPPLKVDRNKTLSMSATFTAGVLNQGGTAMGFEVDTLEK